jgi:hypothetical protein
MPRVLANYAVKSVAILLPVEALVANFLMLGDSGEAKGAL